MPLPPNTTLSLLGYSRPGDALPSRPKQAMLVRLSSETLDALESFSTQPQVQFEFGESPGIYIGDVHFPMRHSPETSIHELFLRASSATKKSAPLKLHANIVGKFAVERELVDEIREKVRESTQEAANQRNQRTTVFIDAPLPDLQSNARKRKEPPSSSSMFRKPLRAADKVVVSQPTSTTASANKRPVVPSQTQRDNLNPIRKRIVQCLALGEKTEDQVFKLIGPSDQTSSSRRDIEALLDQVAEMVSTKGGSLDKSQKLYRLKPVVWKEVRPYEWSISEQERISVGRSARHYLNTLGIPKTDPAWDHVQYRNPTTMPSSTDQTRMPSSSASVDDPSRPKKQGISSRETKEKKNKPKVDPRGEIMMKDESIRTAPRATQQAQQDEILKGTSSRRAAEYSLNSAAERREPSHVSKVMKSQISRDSPSPSTKTPNARHINRDARGNKSISTQDERNVISNPSQKIKKVHLDNETAIDSDREKRRSKIGPKDQAHDESTGLHSKRKATDHGQGSSQDATGSIKRRKADPQVVSSSNSSLKEDRTKDIPPIRKSYAEPSASEKLTQKSLASTSSSQRIKKRNESPPVPPKRHATSSLSERVLSESSSRSHGSGINGSQGSKSHGLAKPPRRSAHYTSSEDDDEDALSTRRPPGNDSLLNLTAPTSRSQNSNTSRLLSTDHATLRARYSSSYVEYLGTFHKLMVQKGKLNRMLKNNDLTSTITDSDGEGELLGPEELAQLAGDHRILTEELETIQQIFEQTKGVLTS